MLLTKAGLGRAVKGQAGVGGTNSFEVYDKGGRSMGGCGRRTSFNCFVVLPCSRSGHPFSFSFYLQQINACKIFN